MPGEINVETTTGHESKFVDVVEGLRHQALVAH